MLALCTFDRKHVEKYVVPDKKDVLDIFVDNSNFILNNSLNP